MCASRHCQAQEADEQLHESNNKESDCGGILIQQIHDKP